MRMPFYLLPFLVAGEEEKKSDHSESFNIM